ncbi:hypothetical protein NZD85_12180 [Empedobacter stercoris]|uniref:Uncharacterized protein n=2 Tax=Empedobacter TaxID=59734 RepID=A0ABY8V6M4_9FLAO|nr:MULTISPECIES: hypothetical protein [Empedobacter]MCA4777299.1 hypothetical protein [Empedobacter stercoris]MDM1543761.1 hypothetical protein [Empedobacter sp. 189-2]UWX66627.1 hypothetical protein NZD85_12180 [Empedobacter stercoris]WIH96807.1 hypothetical protein OBA43_11160 [Empedobacter falsenii]
MMKKALECALILTRKHQLLGDKIALSTDYLKKIELNDKQTEINKQMVDFLIELQEFVEFIKVNQELKLMYTELVNYYFKQIHHQINFYEIELDRLEFESKFSINLINQIKRNEKNGEINSVQEKLNSCYNIINS